jgi:hypothetical protein
MAGVKFEEIYLKGRLDGKQRLRLEKLLNMMYTPKELSEEIGFNVRQVYRVYIPAGCPNEKDSKGHNWINGKLFREWVGQIYEKRELLENEAFCLTCKIPIVMKNPEKKQKDRLVYWICECPTCGRKIARIIDREKRKND